MENISVETAEMELLAVLEELKSKSFDENELQKVKNKFEANFMLGQTNILNKAMGLAYFEMLGNASDINLETQKYQSISQIEITETVKNVFTESNCSTLYYLAEKNK
jgi:hypothetical protein